MNQRKAFDMAITLMSLYSLASFSQSSDKFSWYADCWQSNCHKSGTVRSEVLWMSFYCSLLAFFEMKEYYLCRPSAEYNKEVQCLTASHLKTLKLLNLVHWSSLLLGLLKHFKILFLKKNIYWKFCLSIWHAFANVSVCVYAHIFWYG